MMHNKFLRCHYEIGSLLLYADEVLMVYDIEHDFYFCNLLDAWFYLFLKIQYNELLVRLLYMENYFGVVRMSYICYSTNQIFHLMYSHAMKDD